MSDLLCFPSDLRDFFQKEYDIIKPLNKEKKYLGGFIMKKRLSALLLSAALATSVFAVVTLAE